MKKLHKKIQDFFDNRVNKKVMHNVMMTVTSLVVFITVYALILPAITISKEEIPELNDAVSATEEAAISSGEEVNAEAESAESEIVEEATSDVHIESDASSVEEDNETEDNETEDNETEDNETMEALEELSSGELSSEDDSQDAEEEGAESETTDSQDEAISEENAEADKTETAEEHEEILANLVDFTIKRPVKAVYDLYEKLDFKGLTVEATYEDGSKKTLSDDEYIIDSSLFDNTKEGTYKIEVKVGEIAKNYDVKVKDSGVINIAKIEAKKEAEEKQDADGNSEIEEDKADEFSEETTLITETTEVKAETTETTGNKLLVKEESKKVSTTKEVSSQEELLKSKITKGTEALTEEEIAMLSPEELAKLNLVREVKAELLIPLDGEEAGLSPFMMLYNAKSAKMTQTYNAGMVSVKLPIGYFGEKFKINADILNKSNYNMDEKHTVFAYRIKVVYADNVTDSLGNILHNEGDLFELSDEDINEGKQIEYNIYQTGLNLDSSNGYSLYYLPTVDVEEAIKKEVELSASDISASNGEKYSKIVFSNQKTGVFVMYQNSDGYNANSKDEVSIQIDIINSNISADELNLISMGYSETDKVRNEYTLEHKIVRDEQEVLVQEKLKKLYAYDIYLEKNEVVYQLNKNENEHNIVEVSISENNTQNLKIYEAKKEKYRVYYVKNGEVLKEHQMKIIDVRDGKIIFETDHFSDYAVFESDKDNSEVENSTEIVLKPGEDISLETFVALVKQESKKSTNEVLIKMNNTVNVDKAFNLSNALSDAKTLILERAEGFTHEFFRVNSGSSLAVSNIKLDGMGYQFANQNEKSYAPLIANHGNLLLGENALLTNNVNYGPYTYFKNFTGSQTVASDYPYLAQGGAVWSSGDLEIDGATIRDCKAQLGGGIYIEGEQGHQRSSFLLRSGSIDNNEAKYFGDDSGKNNYRSGQRFSSISGYHYNPQVHPNHRYSFDVNRYICSGGGVFIGEHVNATILGGEISGNTSSRSGGGVGLGYMSRDVDRLKQTEYISKLAVMGGVFSENITNACGGGLYIDSAYDAIITGGTFYNNRAWGRDSYDYQLLFSGGGIYVDGNGFGGVGESGSNPTNVGAIPGRAIIKNVLIEGNSSRWTRGQAVAACQTSELSLFNVDGGFIYNNQTQYDYCVHVESTNILPVLSDKALGGAKNNWYGSGNYLKNKNVRQYKNDLTSQDRADLEASGLVKVEIKNNYGDLGGGIATNGILEIGTEPPAENDNFMSVSVLKKWKGDVGSDRPEKIIVNLFKNNEPSVFSSVELSKDNNWYHEWSGLEIAEYTVVEKEIEGYSSSVEVNNDVAKKVNSLENGFDYLISSSAGVLVNKELNKYWDTYWNNYTIDHPINKIRWRAEYTKTISVGGKDTNLYRLRNRDSNLPLTLWGASNKISVSKRNEKSEDFGYFYNSDTEAGTVGALYYDKFYCLTNSLGTYSYGKYVKANKDSGSKIDLYKVIDREFVITNTKDELKPVGLVLHKIDGADSKPLGNAEFSLYMEDSSDDAVAIEGTEGKKGLLVGAYMSDVHGDIVINDLIPDRVYFLKETKAPNGYMKLKTIVFSLNQNGKYVKLQEEHYPTSVFENVSQDAAADSDNTVMVFGAYNSGTHMYVKNNFSAYVLPATGGMGTKVLTLIGIIMLVSSLGLVWIKYKKRRLS